MNGYMSRVQLIEALQASNEEHVMVQFMNDKNTHDYMRIAPIDEPVECGIVDLADGVIMCEVL